MAGVVGTADFLRRVRGGVDVTSIRAESRKPFRIFLCGDLSLIGEMRSLLLSGEGETPTDAAATLETIVLGRPVAMSDEARAVVFLGQHGDREGADLEALFALKLPVYVIIVNPDAEPFGPANPPEKGV